jgi:hypothetical protein
VHEAKYAMARFADHHAHGPLALVAERVAAIERDLDAGVLSTGTNVWAGLSSTTKRLGEVTRWSVWHSNHWLWLLDMLHNGTVTNAEWGSLEKFGARDNSIQTSRPDLEPPVYQFAGPDLHGMRWEIVSQLLQELDPEGPTPRAVVEVGVFAGHFSDFILSQNPKLQLVGIDPYIGKDNTFPGTFSETLDPNEALAYAAQTYMKYEPRGQLMQGVSSEIAPAIANESLDGVFIDGCHLYECVRDDIELWLPKVKPGGFVAGHDFSPQWPGVVRAVHEARTGRDVTLGMDWMYWWTKER